MSEVPGPTNGPPTDFTDAYQSWVVYRKLPVMVGRLERTLAIDGDHIHVSVLVHDLLKYRRAPLDYAIH